MLKGLVCTTLWKSNFHYLSKVLKEVHSLNQEVHFYNSLETAVEKCLAHKKSPINSCILTKISTKQILKKAKL